jgi:hypothetical protein
MRKSCNVLVGVLALTSASGATTAVPTEGGRTVCLQRLQGDAGPLVFLALRRHLSES